MVCLSDDVFKFVTWCNSNALVATIYSQCMGYRCGKKEIKIEIVNHPAEILAALARGDSAVVSMLWAIRLISVQGDFRVEGLRFSDESVVESIPAFVVVGKNPVVLTEK